jgi:dihydrofolate reductase
MTYAAQHTGGTVGKVLWHVTLSLDGFIAGPADAMDWIFGYAGPNETVDEVIRMTGALLAGRRCYDIGRREGQPPQAQKPYGGAWTGPQFVLTHHIPDGEDDPNITFINEEVSDAVPRALAAAGGKNVGVLGASIARQCLDAGLIDDILVHLAPVLLGDGVRLFSHPGTSPIKLEPIGVTQAGPITNLRFRVVK